MPEQPDDKEAVVRDLAAAMGIVAGVTGEYFMRDAQDAEQQRVKAMLDGAVEAMYRALCLLDGRAFENSALATLPREVSR